MENSEETRHIMETLNSLDLPRCPHCKGMLGPEALACPHCLKKFGYNYSPTGAWWLLFTGMVISSILAAILISTGVTATLPNGWQVSVTVAGVAVVFVAVLLIYSLIGGYCERKTARNISEYTKLVRKHEKRIEAAEEEISYLKSSCDPSHRWYDN